MQPVRVRIEGDYEDAYLYMGKLFLLRNGGGLLVLDWDGLVAELSSSLGEESVSLQWMLGQNQVLYGRGIAPYLASPTIRMAFVTLLRRLTRRLYDVNLKTLGRHIWYEGDLIDERITDLHLYMRRLYFSTRQGTYAASLAPQRKRRRMEDPVRIWDGEALAFSSYWRNLYAAAGEDGLWGCPQAPGWEEWSDEPSEWQRIGGPVTSLRVYSSFGDISNITLDRRLVYLSASAHHPDRHESLRTGEPGSRQGLPGEEGEPPSIGDLTEIDFWLLAYQYEPLDYSDAAAGREKVFFREDGVFHSYQKWRDESNFEEIGTKQASLGGDALDIAVGNFGLVLDMPDGAYLLNDDGVRQITSSPSTRCRTFPQSNFYQNMFLSVQDDHVLVGSVADDMLRNQRTKTMGLYGSPNRGKF